jgi:glycopeptide antibiotics resistance protein
MRVRLILFILYLAALFKLLFLKLTFQFSDISIGSNDTATFKRLFAESNFIPFYRIYYYLSGQEPYLVGALNLVGNIVLFIPMGIFIPVIFERIKTAKRLLITMAILCFCIEVLQLITTTGQFDIDDVLLNVAGAMIGYCLYRSYKRRLGEHSL